jgi:peptidoglycan/LPS O-acetylase OafA/YrhL
MDALASSTDTGPVVTTIAARHKNLFDLLRLVAATMVLWGHAFFLTGNPSPGWFGNDVGTIGVKIFFLISGLMITRSWLDDPRLWAFTMRRVLRIMPGLILVVLVTAFVMGPLVTTLPVGEYFRSYGTRFYLWNILLFPIYNLPGVFAGNIYPNAVNGSLWSLPAEVCMYILTPLVLGRQPAIARASIVVVASLFIICGLYCVRISPLHSTPEFYGTSLVSLLDAAPYFQIGALFAVFKLDRSGRPLFSLFLVLVCAEFVQQVGKGNNFFVLAEIMLLLTLPYAVISVGTVRLRGRIGQLLNKPDVSYGMYLYGFPIEQLISAAFHGHISGSGEFAVALPFTFICATLSWVTVEKTALRLKPSRPAAKWIAK